MPCVSEQCRVGCSVQLLRCRRTPTSSSQSARAEPSTMESNRTGPLLAPTATAVTSGTVVRNIGWGAACGLRRAALLPPAESILCNTALTTAVRLCQSVRSGRSSVAQYTRLASLLDPSHCGRTHGTVGAACTAPHKRTQRAPALCFRSEDRFRRRIRRVHAAADRNALRRALTRACRGVHYGRFIRYEDAIHPLSNAPEPKRRFVPSKWEHKTVVKMVRAIRNGNLKLGCVRL